MAINNNFFLIYLQHWLDVGWILLLQIAFVAAKLLEVNVEISWDSDYVISYWPILRYSNYASPAHINRYTQGLHLTVLCRGTVIVNVSPILQGWHTDTETINHKADSKVHGANMGPIWGQQDPGGPHVGPMNFALCETVHVKQRCRWSYSAGFGYMHSENQLGASFTKINKLYSKYR